MDGSTEPIGRLRGAPRADYSNPIEQTRLTGCHHTEFVAIRIGHDHPVDFTLANVYTSRPNRLQSAHLRLLISVHWRSKVEMQSVLAGFRHQRRTTPREFGTAEGRANCGLLVLIPHQWPAKRLTPEVPDLP